MKKSILKTVLPLLAVALVGVVFATSCEKEHEIINAKGYFVQLKEPGGLTEIHERVTAYLYTDSNCITYPHEIVGEFGCNMPAGYVKGDTIYAETRLEKLYPIEGEICFGTGPYYKLLSIKRLPTTQRQNNQEKNLSDKK
ncbi:MAG: hypothetical protein IKQ94_07090 [Bacteroidales bacterium]|nr:hypothetical protein [Bacteroidales bacterium]